MPNLQGASQVGRNDRGHSYAARTVSRGRTESTTSKVVAAFGTCGEMLSPVGRAGERAEHGRRAGVCERATGAHARVVGGVRSWNVGGRGVPERTGGRGQQGLNGRVRVRADGDQEVHQARLVGVGKGSLEGTLGKFVPKEWGNCSSQRR